MAINKETKYLMITRAFWRKFMKMALLKRKQNLTQVNIQKNLALLRKERRNGKESKS